jgi:glutamate-1-semialdehyde 2,1-aminomutase
MTLAVGRNITLEDALRDAEARYIEANPKSRARHAEACAALPGGNTRSILFYPPFPVTLTRGAGARLWDLDGHVYTDFLGEYTAGLYGHSHPAIQAAVRAALDDGIVLGGPNPHEAELARLICARFPSCDLVRFCYSGTEANINALCAARAITGRSHVLVFDGGYHGGPLTFAHGGSPMNLPFPWVIGSYNDLDATLPLIERHARELAAIIVEPMMGAAGAIAGEPAFLQGLRDATSRHGIILIFDEVMTSRLSPGGLQAKLGITPDLTTFGKYLGGGLSFGAFGGRAELMARFDPRHPDALPHSGTYNNNVLTMAAGVAGLSEVFTPEAAIALNETAEALRARLNRLARAAGAPVQVAGVGSIMCVHFHDRPIIRPSDGEASDPRARALFHLDMLERGFYLARRGFISPSLALEPEDYAAFASAFEGFVETYGSVLSNGGR